MYVIGTLYFILCDDIMLSLVIAYPSVVNCDNCHMYCMGRLTVVVPGRTTQPSRSPGSVSEDHLRQRRKRKVWFIPFRDKGMCGR